MIGNNADIATLNSFDDLIDVPRAQVLNGLLQRSSLRRFHNLFEKRSPFTANRELRRRDTFSHGFESIYRQVKSISFYERAMIENDERLGRITSIPILTVRLRRPKKEKIVIRRVHYHIDLLRRTTAGRIDFLAG